MTTKIIHLKQLHADPIRNILDVEQEMLLAVIKSQYEMATWIIENNPNGKLPIILEGALLDSDDNIELPEYYCPAIQSNFHEGFPKNISEFTESQLIILYQAGAIYIFTCLEIIEKFYKSIDKEGQDITAHFINRMQTAIANEDANVIINALKEKDESLDEEALNNLALNPEEILKIFGLFDVREKKLFEQIKIVEENHFVNNESNKTVLIVYGGSHDLGYLFNDSHYNFTAVDFSGDYRSTLNYGD